MKSSNKKVIVQLNLNTDLKEKLDILASDKGLSLGPYLRMKIIEFEKDGLFNDKLV